MTAAAHRGPRGPRTRSVRVRLVAVVAVLVTVGAGIAAYAVRVAVRPDCVADPVAGRAVAELRGWTGWLARNHVRGYVGEVGWPGTRDARAWSRVGSRWYAEADREGLWVTAWATGRWWPRTYPMSVYRLRGANVVPVPRPQAAVVEEHNRTDGTLRGMDLPSGAFGSGAEGAGWYSGTRPGVFGKDYYYDDDADFSQLAATGTQVVRLSVTWERLQPRLGRPLDTREVARLGRALDAAQRAGVGVVLDLHNYGDYWVAAPRDGHRRLVLGSRELPGSDLVDFWRRMSTALEKHTSVLGLGLMNEPTGMATDPRDGARTWERVSQRVVERLRAAGDRHLLLVSGYGGASPSTWATYHPRAWIQDPLDEVRYETHQYFDADRTGHYARSFAEETARARTAGYTGSCSSPDRTRVEARVPVPALSPRPSPSPSSSPVSSR